MISQINSEFSLKMQALWHTELFARYYNCSFYDYETAIPRDLRRNTIPGAILLVLYGIFEVPKIHSKLNYSTNFSHSIFHAFGYLPKSRIVECPAIGWCWPWVLAAFVAFIPVAWSLAFMRSVAMFSAIVPSSIIGLGCSLSVLFSILFNKLSIIQPATPLNPFWMWCSLWTVAWKCGTVKWRTNYSVEFESIFGFVPPSSMDAVWDSSQFHRCRMAFWLDGFGIRIFPTIWIWLDMYIYKWGNNI